jgi:hypothetical protein
MMTATVAASMIASSEPRPVPGGPAAQGMDAGTGRAERRPVAALRRSTETLWQGPQAHRGGTQAAAAWPSASPRSLAGSL